MRICLLRCQRSIPAWAGEPSLRPRYPCGEGVYPRVGGGTMLVISFTPAVLGLSPRGRGNLGGAGVGGVR